jgi:hypothetical protein
MMDESLKEKLREISSWSVRNDDGKKVLSVEDFLSDNEKRKIVGEASKTLNRIGYFVYREFVGDWFIQEQYSGLILDSFLAMKPYLKALRDESECRADKKRGRLNGVHQRAVVYEALLSLTRCDQLCLSIEKLSRAVSF